MAPVHIRNTHHVDYHTAHHVLLAWLFSHPMKLLDYLYAIAPESSSMAAVHGTAAVLLQYKP